MIDWVKEVILAIIFWIAILILIDFIAGIKYKKQRKGGKE